MVEVAFKTDYGKILPRIIIASVLFHLLVVVGVIGANYLIPKPKVEKIPIFDVIKLPPPKGVKHRRPPAPRPETPKPPEPKPVQQPKPVEPKPLPAEPKIDPKPKPLPPPVEEPKVVEPPPVEEPAPADEFDLPSDEPEGDPNGMDLPNLSQLHPVGDLEMDPLMQVYLEQLQMILMQNFSPPAGLTIPPGAKTSVQFTIQRNGQITAILLKKSSGNATWDRLATRSVSISRLPPLPPNFRAPFLPLVFDFKEK